MITIKLRDKQYPILFSLDAVEQIQNRYGDITKLSAKLQDINEIKWILMTFINQGLKYQAFDFNTPVKLVTEDDMSLLLSWKDMYNGELAQKIIDAFNESLGAENPMTAEQIVSIGNSMIMNQTVL